ncbi:MAG: hypothetical protein COS99_01975 [Candidatus Omnitrophica bacterium CG07_land_8_20_14_0_80_42_15]|uniref:Uncharacterized protein n=1 Tax=Candidatus Aquitaenariimonas noxiae TaxID=1974741 RepID=A0A2J0KUM1_9BACT|nr:MAG: hypothetical protein COS99_01975 [Candidatus Omnitrophica bacterium CG07_land_8_20_14_0_80_42_15]
MRQTLCVLFLAKILYFFGGQFIPSAVEGKIFKRCLIFARSSPPPPATLSGVAGGEAESFLVAEVVGYPTHPAVTIPKGRLRAPPFKKIVDIIV